MVGTPILYTEDY